MPSCPEDPADLLSAPPSQAPALPALSSRPAHPAPAGPWGPVSSGAGGKGHSWVCTPGPESGPGLSLSLRCLHSRLVLQQSFFPHRTRTSFWPGGGEPAPTSWKSSSRAFGKGVLGGGLRLRGEREVFEDTGPLCVPRHTRRFPITLLPPGACSPKETQLRNLLTCVGRSIQPSVQAVGHCRQLFPQPVSGGRGAAGP